MKDGEQPDLPILHVNFGLRQARDFEMLLATEFVVESRQRPLRVATDGEITTMTPPLRYRIRRGSLRVIRADADAKAST